MQNCLDVVTLNSLFALTQKKVDIVKNKKLSRIIGTLYFVVFKGDGYWEVNLSSWNNYDFFLFLWGRRETETERERERNGILSVEYACVRKVKGYLEMTVSALKIYLLNVQLLKKNIEGSEIWDFVRRIFIPYRKHRVAFTKINGNKSL